VTKNTKQTKALSVSLILADTLIFVTQRYA